LNILSLDATTLANKIRTGEISSLEVTEAYIQQIERVNPIINAVVETRFDKARQEAKQKDQLLQKGIAKGKLFGVPISVKESFFVEGMTTTGGIPSRKGYIDAKDSDVVQLLKNEGAIILGKTNTSTLLLCLETDNTVYGPTNNPWNPKYHAGGSSGGEAALIAVGGATVGIGSDIGGSIRIPSHFNGVIGFKSGKQQVSDHGHFPPFRSPFKKDMQGIGPIAKSVNDANLIYEIIAKHPIQEQNITQFKYVFPKTDLHSLLSPLMKETLNAVQEELAKTMNVKEEFPPYFDESVLLWLGVMTYGGLEEERTIAGVRKDEDLYQQDLHPYFTGIIELGKALQPTPEKAQEIFNQRLELEKQVNQYLKNKVMVLPVYHKTAQKHGQMVIEALSSVENIIKYLRFTAYVNAFGLPALVIPVREDKTGLPFAIQLITAVGQEDALFKTGLIIENSFRGYKRCTHWDTD
jgi:fatty acid amide hydrolase 2